MGFYQQINERHYPDNGYDFYDSGRLIGLFPDSRLYGSQQGTRHFGYKPESAAHLAAGWRPYLLCHSRAVTTKKHFHSFGYFFDASQLSGLANSLIPSVQSAPYNNRIPSSLLSSSNTDRRRNSRSKTLVRGLACSFDPDSLFYAGPYFHQLKKQPQISQNLH